MTCDSELIVLLRAGIINKNFGNSATVGILKTLPEIIVLIVAED